MQPRVTTALDRVFGNPLQWSPSKRALAMQVLIAPFVVAASLRARFLVAHPEIEPFADRAVMSALALGMYVFIGVAIGSAVIGLIEMRRGRESRVLLHAVVQLYWILWGVAAYLHGLPTSPFWVIFPLLAMYSLLLFDMQVTIGGIVTALAIVFGTTILERLDIIPYAPLIAEKPFAGRRAPDVWIWPPMIWPPIASLAAFGVFAVVLQRSREHQRHLTETKERLEGELREAADYARSVLPEPTPFGAPVRAAWSWVPCAELGGDLFTYFEIEEGRRYGLALVDVCGHGVGGALHAVSMTQTLRRGRLPGVDLGDPAAVISAMNDAYPMEQHGDLFFTIWYGVLDLEKETLRYASGGHPPALLFSRANRDSAAVELTTRGPTPGVMKNAAYHSAEVSLNGGVDLFVFSDGAFELTKPDGRLLDWSSFTREVAALARRDDLRPNDMYAWALQLTGQTELEDDFSLVHIRLGARQC